MTRWVLAVATLCLALATRAPGRDIFVNNVTGDDRRDGTTPTVSGRFGGPCRTIAKALRMAENGDQIFLAKTDEPYRESITVQAGRQSGVESRPFAIVGNGAVLDGSKPVPKDVWEHYESDVFRFRPSRMSYQVLYLDGKPAKRRAARPGQGVAKMEPLEWCLYDRHVYFRVEKDKLPRQYELSHTALPVGITLYEVRHVMISDLVVQGFQLDGVNAHDGVVDATLVGLTCRGNGRSGISVGGASRVKIVACLVGDNGAAQVRTEGLSRTEIVNCDLIEGELAPALVREGGLVSMVGDAPAANQKSLPP